MGTFFIEIHSRNGQAILSKSFANKDVAIAAANEEFERQDGYTVWENAFLAVSDQKKHVVFVTPYMRSLSPLLDESARRREEIWERMMNDIETAQEEGEWTALCELRRAHKYTSGKTDMLARLRSVKGKEKPADEKDRQYNASLIEHITRIIKHIEGEE